MTNQYKLPICWLGKAQVHDGKEHYVLPDEVNMNCTCVTPMQALLCMEGHMTECHKGMSCRGEKHGPYWYGHGDFGVPKYIGRMLPQWITDHVALLKKSKPKISPITVNKKIDKSSP